MTETPTHVRLPAIPAQHVLPSKRTLHPNADTQHQSFWLWVVCLVGLDYFSTLAYQPSIAFTAAGRLAPISTIFLVLLTLFGALPVYWYIAGRSPHGQGSLAMFQRLMSGWSAKVMLLVMLGFAATDFVITMTLSAADAAEHLIHNPIWATTPSFLHSQFGLTVFVLLLLGVVFLKGVKEVVAIAVPIVAVFLTLNAILIGAGLVFLANHPHYIAEWWHHVSHGELAFHGESDHARSYVALLLLAALYFPKLILGLSGFETGVAVMPHVKGDATDTHQNPAGRIRNTRKMLVTAACVMSCLLMGASIVVTLLIPAEQLHEGGRAANRALAFLAHGEGDIKLAWFCGDWFGTLYDLSTIVILGFAGASAMSGLINLIPRFLPHYGMAPSWAGATRPLVLIITGTSLIVTYVFNANVASQGAAYATGVMVLMLAGCIAVAIERFKNRGLRKWLNLPWGTYLIAMVFTYATLDVLYEKPDGLMIASCFIAAILIVSMVSRISRSTELRVVKFEFYDHESQFLWNTLQDIVVPVLAPHRPGARSLEEKEHELRTWHHIPPETPVVFVEVQIGDPSDFYQSPRVRLVQRNGSLLIQVDRCTATAPALAAIALALNQQEQNLELHFGWSDENPMRTNFGFLLFGEGNVPWLVRDLIRRAEPNERRRPRIIVG